MENKKMKKPNQLFSEAETDHERSFTSVMKGEELTIRMEVQDFHSVNREASKTGKDLSQAVIQRERDQYLVSWFCREEDPECRDWKNVISYCEDCPSARRSLMEAHLRPIRKYGIDSPETIAEIRRFLHGFFQDAARHAHMKEKNFIEDLLDQARANPERIAVVDQNGERSITYRDFVVLIRRIAAKIQSFSLPKGSFIIINMERSREYLASMYAIVYAGYAFIPLVLETPKEREEYIRTEADCELIIREDFFADIDDFPESEGTDHQEEDTAMMLYTSGSTGRPKGVVYSFGPLSRCYQDACFILEDIDPIIYASSIAYSFAAISVDTFHVFCRGGTLHVLDDETRKDVAKMSAYYQKHGITVGNVHPRLHKHLCPGPQLKRIFTSGHRITDFYSDQFETYLGYGLAETFAVPTYFRLDHAYSATPVGKCHDGYTVIVCDENGNEVKDGEKGEVRIAGDIAGGYFKQPELTEKTFERREDGTILLHTHDIGYKDENGDLNLINRDDWLVKINGMSVNPAEIDFAMSKIEGIRESAAKGFTDANGNPYLCDFYVSDEESLTPAILKEILSKSLMPYMIPSVFVKLDQLPQTISSKVDYTALKAPERTASYEEPVNAEERRIASAFEAVIGRGKIGRKDDFFEAGGDSLSMIELLAKLDDTALSIADIAEYRTPEKIAAFLNQRREENPEPDCENESFPLTPYQAHYMNACISAGEITMGNSPFALRLCRKTYDASFIKEAALKAVLAHPALRSVFEKGTDGRIHSRFDPESLIRIEIEEVKESELEETLQACLKPFALLNSPLVRIRLFQTDEVLVLFLDVHHIIFDHQSLRVLIRDLFAAYRGESLKADRYPDYLLHMRNRLKRGEADRLQKELRKKYRKDYARHPAFDRQGFSYHTEMITRRIRLKAENMKSLRDGRKPGIQAGLIAAALLAMHQDTGKDKAVCGWLYNGRDSARKMNMAGLLISSLISDADFASIHSSEELLERVQTGMRRSLPMAELSPGSLLGGPGEEDLITVNYTAYAKEEAIPHAQKISLINTNTANTCVFYIILNEKEDGSADLLFKYNDTVYSPEHIERFIGCFFAAVKALSEDGMWMEELS